MKAPYKMVLAKMSMKNLVETFCMTEKMNGEDIPTVRGWLMDEIESRNPEGFDRWMDESAEDSDLGKYVLKEER